MKIHIRPDLASVIVSVDPIDDEHESMPLLCRSEVESLGELRNGRRRRHRIIGHLAAHGAMELLGETCPGITYTDKGRPVAGSLGLSISHGDLGGFAFVSREQQKIGLDVEKIETRPTAFLREAFTPSQVSWIKEHPESDLEATRLFCLKEAITKAHGDGFYQALHKVDLTVNSSGWQRLGGDHILLWVVL